MRWSSEQVSQYTANRKTSVADSYILERIDDLSPERLIEIGCGPGIIASKASSITDYVCSDLTYNFLAVTSAIAPSVTCVNCSAESLPFSDNSADCVISMVVLHHLNSTELSHAIREIYRILIPGGTFILLEDWCFTQGFTEFEELARLWRFRNGSDENHLSSEEWQRRITLAGFKCGKPVWVNRPFSTADPSLLRWPERERAVRMMALESVKLP